MKTREIIYIGILFFTGFLVSEFLIEHMAFDYPLQRFMARIIFQSGFYLVLYLLFTVKDVSRRLRLMEMLYSRERRIRVQGCRFRLQRKIANRKEMNGRLKRR